MLAIEKGVSRVWYCTCTRTIEPEKKTDFYLFTNCAMVNLASVGTLDFMIIFCSIWSKLGGPGTANGETMIMKDRTNNKLVTTDQLRK